MLGWSVVRMQQNQVSCDKTHLITQSPLSFYFTLNSEIFVRILFSRIVLNDIFATRARVTLISYRVISPFCEGFIFTKLRENKTLAKISEFTVFLHLNLIFFRQHHRQ